MSESIGTVFVEINLDKTKFEYQQQKLIDDTKKVANAVEGSLQKSFQNLSVKTDNLYQLMANKAIVSYERIKQAANTSAAEEYRARSAMISKINSLRIEKAHDPLFDTLGVKSQAMIEAQRTAVLSSYDAIKKSGTATAQDLVNIERAKNEKLKSLNKEMVGHHDMSMAAMTRAVLRFYAAWYVMSTGLGAVKNMVMGGVQAIDEMKISAIGVAAQITSMQGSTGNIAENYKTNLKYAQALVPVMMEIDAASFANLDQLQKMNQAMVGQGVILDANNKKQKDAFTAISNSIALLTAGSSSPTQQAYTEMRALMSGQLRQGAEVARSIDAIIKKEGIYKDGLKEVVAEGEKHGDTLERLEPYFKGIIEASGDIQHTWASASSSLQTAYTILQTNVFKDFYTTLVDGGQKLGEFIKRHTDDIVYYVKATFDSIVYGLGVATTVYVTLRVTGMAAAAALKASFASLFFFIEGYAFGTWLNSFKDVQIAALVAIDGIIGLFNGLEYTLKSVFLKVQDEWATRISNMKASVAGFLDFVAAGFDYIPGLSGAAEALRGYANGFDPVIAKTKTLAEKEAALYQEYIKQEDIRKKTTEGRIKDIGAAGAAASKNNIETPEIAAARAAETAARDDAAKAAKDRADQIAKVIENIQFETAMLSLSEDEQYRMNQLKAAGIDITDKMAASVLKVADAYLVAKKNADAWKPFLDFMSDDQQNETSIAFHEGSMAVQAENLQSMVDYWPEIADASSDSAEKADKAWEEAAKNIQNAWAGLFSKIFRGEITGANDVLKELMYTMSDNAAQDFAVQFQKIDWIKTLGGPEDGIGKFFKDILKDFNLTAGQAVNSLAAVIATAYSAVGMAKKDAALSGAMTGASVGGSSGGGYGAAAGLVLGGAAGYMIGSNEPSYGERLADAIGTLVDALKKNTQSLMQQLQGMSDLEKAQENLKTAIFETTIEGTKTTLAENFKVPEGVKRRTKSGLDQFADVYVAFAKDLVSGMQDSYQRSLDLTLHGTMDSPIRDKGYTTFDFSKEEMTTIMSGLYDKLGIGQMLSVMKQTTTDPGALIRALDEAGYISAEISDKKLAYYSEGSSKAQRNKTVAEGWVGVLEEAALQMAVIAQGTADASENYMKAFDSEKLNEYQKAVQDINDSMGKYASDAKGQIKTLQDLLAVEGLSEEQRKSFSDQLERLIPIQENYDRVLKETEEKYKALQQETLTDMTKEVDIASGKYSQLEQSYMSIMDKAEAYRLELIANGKSYEEAGNAARDYAVDMKTTTKNAQMAATALAYNNNITQKNIDLLTLLGKTDEAEAAIRKQTLDTRIAEVQSLKDIYGANTELFQTNLDLAKASWAADDALSSATTRLAKMAAAMAGMWGEDSILEAKQAWITVLESLGETVTPKFFLDSIGLGTDSGLEHLLSATTSDEVHADLTELITLWRTGEIKQDDFNAILSKINDNASEIAQHTKDMAENWAAMNAVGKESNAWLHDQLDTPASAFEEAIKQVDTDLEDFRTRIVEAGSSVAEGWEKGGYIENAVKDAIRKNFLADLDTEISESLSAFTQSDYMRSIVNAEKTYNDMTLIYTSATKQMSDVELNSAISEVRSRAEDQIDAAGVKISSMTAWLEKFKGYYEANGDPQGFYAEETARLALWLTEYNDKIAVINENADAEVEALKTIVFSSEKLAEIQAAYALEIQAINKGLYDSVRGTLYNVTGDTDILQQELIDLAKDWKDADANDYAAQYDALGKMYDVQKQILDVQKEQLQTAIDNYTTLEDVKLSLQGGSLAPVQSLEFFDRRYAQLFEGAQSGKTEDISAFTNFISTYADFMGGIDGLDYKNLTTSIINDLTGLQTTISGGATLDDLNAQLEALNSADSPIVAELVRIGDLLAGKTGSGSLSDALAFDETAYLNRYADVAAAVASNDFMSGYEHYQSFGKDEGRIPGFASGGSHFGGLRLVGERGPEIEYTGPSRIQSNESMTKMITNAVVAALGGRTSGDVVVTVNLDGKAIEPRMVKVLKTNQEAQYQMKRAANGR